MAFRGVWRRAVPRRFLCHFSHGTAPLASSRRNVSGMEIPGPKSYPVVGSLISALRDKDFDKDKIEVYFKKLLDQFGPIVKFRFPGQPTSVLFSRPEDFKDIFFKTRENPVRGGLQALKVARYADKYYERKSGVTTEDGDEWRRVRQAVQATVLKPENISYYMDSMDEVCQDLLDRISKERSEAGDLTADMMHLLNVWSIENVCLISMNGRLGCLDPNLPPDSEQMRSLEVALEILRAIFECEINLLWKLYPTKTFKSLQKSLAVLTDICDRRLRELKDEIAQRNLEDPDRNLSMVEQLLLNSHLSHKDVVTFMIDLMPGGTETTSQATMVVLYLLAKHPHVQAKVQEEVDRVLGGESGPITRKQYAKLSYVKATFKESLRLLPPALGVNRLLQEDVEVRGYHLQKGWNCIMLSGLSGLDESYFRRADEFVPERWLRHRPEGPITPHASLPFSSGVRMCLGRRHAEQAACILIARTLQRFNLRWKGDALKREHRVVFKAASPYYFAFIDRSGSCDT